MGRAGALTYRVLRASARGVARPYWRFRVVDEDRFPRQGAYVVCPIHRSNLDFLIAGMATPTHPAFMAKSSIFKGGSIDRFLGAMGAISVHRDRLDRAAVKESLRRLNAGTPLVVFPEGRRKTGSQLEEPFDGAAYLACHARVPLVPVGIAGSDEAMPIGAKLVYPRRVLVTIGEPIYPEVPLSGVVPRSDVDATTKRLVAAIQAEYERAQRLRAM